LMEAGLGGGSAIFPVERRLKSEIRRQLESAVFSGFSLKVEKQGPQKRLVLSADGSAPGLPFMVWSAGQREFVPLLLGLYWVMPSTQTKRRGNTKWVVVEEIEMGLHPKAISVMLLIVLDLLWRGYRVCLSTHSPHVLDLVWAMRMFRDHRGQPNSVLDLFGVRHTPSMVKVAESALQAETKVFYFDPSSRTARDISSLDPGSPEVAEAGWGGLTEFSGHVADEVARVVAAENK
jgi:putative AbiEii toxin of type IV toxin-antitoxin system